MASAIAGPARRFGPANGAHAAAAIAAALLLVLGQEQFRRGEALISATIVRFLRIFPADSLGTAIVFPAEGRYVGFTVSPSCTAALLIVPFALLTALLLLAGRVQPRRAGATVALFAVVLILVNQLRLLVITLSVRGWGFETGFARSHVLLGTVVSTVGVAGGLLLFLRMVVPTGRRRA